MDKYLAVERGSTLETPSRIFKEKVPFFSICNYGVQLWSLEQTKQTVQGQKKNLNVDATVDSKDRNMNMNDNFEYSDCDEEVSVPRQRSLSFPLLDSKRRNSLQFCPNLYSHQRQRCPSCETKRKDSSETVHCKFLNIPFYSEAVTSLHLTRNETVFNLRNVSNPTAKGDSHAFYRNLKTYEACSNTAQSLEYSPLKLSLQRRTLYLLDWDDTLFPSTALDSFESFESLSEELKLNVDQLEQTIVKLLTELNRTGFVAIVTNANEDWVQTSCRCFMPKLLSCLNELKITVVSARKLFGCDSVSPISICPSDWKAAAFLKLMMYFFSSTATRNVDILKLRENQSADSQRSYEMTLQRKSKEGRPPVYTPWNLSELKDPKTWLKAMDSLSLLHEEEQKGAKNVFSTLNQSKWKFEKAVLLDNNSFACHHIIAMGDSFFEHDALTTLREKYRKALFKFIHFVSEPSIVDLLLELKSVSSILDQVSPFVGNLEVFLTRE